MTDLFNDNGAEFSQDRKYRYSLWRIWDKSKPLVMFIGLNPSTANGETDDRTIESVSRISRHNGYGGFYMMNCWSYIATDPDLLKIDLLAEQWNNNMIYTLSKKCKDVVFAWGNFKIVRDHGSPGHPLFKKGDSQLIKF